MGIKALLYCKGEIKMNKTVVIIHTVLSTVEILKQVFLEVLPEVKRINIVDESLLLEVIKEGKIAKKVCKRLYNYFIFAEEIGADIIFNACSSVSEVVDIVRPFVDIPILKIDEPMAEKAVKEGKIIGVVATLKTTLGPTSRLVKSKSIELRKEVKIEERLCKGAFEALVSGDIKKHDELIIRNIKEISNRVDIIVLAQASMARIIPQLSDQVKEKILSSPQLGVQQIKKIIENL